MDNINLFQKKMNDNLIDAYIIPSSDYHMSEYISDFFKSITFLTDFTGSNATLVITRENAYLWVDGRYYLQAQLQIGDKPIEIMRMGQPNTPSVTAFLKEYFSNKEYTTLGFDSKLIETETILHLLSELPSVNVNTDTDIINLIWDTRPELPYSLTYKLSEFFSGRKYKDKINDVIEKMKEYEADVHIITSLDDQAWLFNLRANDIPHTPVFLAYTVITPENTTLFINTRKIDKLIEKYLDSENIIVKEYNEFYEYIKNLKGKKILLNLDTINYEIYDILSKRANILINKPNPTLLLKSIKNKKEIKNIKLAHVKDGVALTKFMYYLKNNYTNGNLTEMSLAETIDELRRKNKGFVDTSFDTISAFNDHSAMMHYSPTAKTDYKIEGNGLLLVDSGGHYMEGSTDVTRTFAIGKINDKMKTHFTTVLKSMIAINKAVFLKGTTGLNLDILAREPIWNLGVDYRSKTGHGVGYLLSIHEGPNCFYWKQTEKCKPQEILPGMVTTNEPGIYLDNKYGIRLENELLCVEKESTEWGEFYEFEILTLCPIDLDAIKPSALTKDEKEWLNQYHERVFNEISPFLTEDEKNWLVEYTKKI